MSDKRAVLAVAISLLAPAATRGEDVAPVSTLAKAQGEPTNPDSTRPQAEPPKPKTVEERLDELGAVIRNAVATRIDRVELHALVDGSFSYNVNEPEGLSATVPPPPGRTAVPRVGSNRLRVNDPDHDSFEVSYAKLGILRTVESEKNEWDAGATFELGAGRLAQTTLSLDPNFGFNDPVNIAQAYVDLQVPTPFGRPLLIRAGRLYGWFGVESLDIPKNPNFSLSYLSNFTPFTHTGVALAMNLPHGFRYTQYLVNGWDLVIDNNDSKSVGGQLLWKLDDPSLVVAVNWLVGPERNDNNRDIRQLYQLDVVFLPRSGTEIRAAFHYGQEEGADVKTGRTAKYGGVLLVFKQELYEVREDFRRFYVAIRGVYWRDQGGSKSGLDQTLYDLTGTFGIQFTTYAGLRFEYRHDFSSRDDFFVGHRGRFTRRDQGTASVDAYLSF